MILTPSVCHRVFAVPNEHGAALRDTDEPQQQPGAQICQRKEHLGGAAAARGADEHFDLSIAVALMASSCILLWEGLEREMLDGNINFLECCFWILFAILLFCFVCFCFTFVKDKNTINLHVDNNGIFPVRV